MAAEAVATTPDKNLAQNNPPLSKGLTICPLSNGNIVHQGPPMSRDKCTECDRYFRTPKPLDELVRDIEKVLKHYRYEPPSCDEPIRIDYTPETFTYLCEMIIPRSGEQLIFSVKIYTDKDYSSQYICELTRIVGCAIDFISIISSFEQILSEF